jgi:hypothetical protein
MQRSVSLLMKWVRTGIAFMLVIAIAVASAPPAASALPKDPAPGDPSLPVYLPVMMLDYAPPPPPTIFELIDSALQSGQIDAETAIEYKTFAEFDDARLPAGFRAGEVGGEVGLFMQKVAGAYPTLSSEAKAVVEPFFIPPFQAGSWASLSVRSKNLSAPSDWVYTSAAGGKARVWYKKGNADLQRKAAVVANALTSDIWSAETTLMRRSPVFDSAGVQNFVVFDHYRSGWNSSFVPFGGYAGMAVPQTCAPTASIIYINPSLPDTGNSTTIGLVETTAHEFMHALQFSFPLSVNPCSGEYAWMGEATATWAEDYVYHGHNTEWRLAKNYLNFPELAINNRYNWRDYGEYLLVYYYTRKYNDPDAVRQAWVNAGSFDSLMSFNSFGNMNFQQLGALWNKEPFDTFFKDSDGLDYQVKPAVDTTLKATGGFKEYDLWDWLKPGGARFFHYKVDPSVHTITILNGLTSKIVKGPNSGNADDLVYNQEDVSMDDMRGADVVTMVKFEGLDEPYVLPNPGRLDFCLDWLKQKVSEIVVIIANNDMTDRNRDLKSTGANTKILVSAVPCMKLTGTATKTNKSPGVVETLSASGLEYNYIVYDILSDQLRYANLISPQIQMQLKKGSVSWQISGTDVTHCTHTGSNSFSITQDNYSLLNLQFQLLPGSLHFMGYDGYAAPDDGAEVTDTIKCPETAPYESTYDPGYFFMPDGEIPVNPDGSLSGSKTFDQGAGISTTFEWNFQPSTLP